MTTTTPRKPTSSPIALRRVALSVGRTAVAKVRVRSGVVPMRTPAIPAPVVCSPYDRSRNGTTLPNTAAAATWPQMRPERGRATFRSPTIASSTAAPRTSRLRTIWLGVRPSRDILMNVNELPHGRASNRKRARVAFFIQVLSYDSSIYLARQQSRPMILTNAAPPYVPTSLRGLSPTGRTAPTLEDGGCARCHRAPPVRAR